MPRRRIDSRGPVRSIRSKEHPVTAWHPILAALEPDPGRWILIDSMERAYGTVTIVRVDGAIRFRAEFRGVLIGHGTTLRGACERVHAAFIAEHGPAPFQGYPDFRPR